MNKYIGFKISIKIITLAIILGFRCQKYYFMRYSLLHMVLTNRLKKNILLVRNTSRIIKEVKATRKSSSL